MENEHIDLSDGVKIYDENGVEIVSWTENEWIEDPLVVYSICQAINVRTTKGSNALKAIIQSK